MIPEETKSGMLSGAVGVILLGAIIAVLSGSVGNLTKLGWIIYDIGIAGLSWIFLDQAFDESNSDNLRIAFAISAALLVTFGFKLLAGL